MSKSTILIRGGIRFTYCHATSLPVLTGAHLWSPARPQSPGTKLLINPSISISGSAGDRGTIGGRRWPARSPTNMFPRLLDLGDQDLLDTTAEDETGA